MVDAGERPGPLGRLERWAGRCLERRYYSTLLACIVAQSAIAMFSAYGPALVRSQASRENIFHDVLVYHEYSDRIAAGEVPYRDFTIEYPPLGAVVFAVPRLVATSFEHYKVALSLEMLAFNAATLALAARWTASRWGIGRVPRCLAWYSAFFLLILPTSMARYDLAVTFATFASAFLLYSGRPAAGGALASVSALLKIFPGVVAAPAMVRELAHLRSSRPRATLAAGLVFAAGLGAWIAIGRGGVLGTIRYHAERGVEIGSIYAGALILAARFGLGESSTVFNHFATHLETPAAMWLAWLATWLQLGAFLLAIGAYWRSGMRDGLRYSTACLLAFVAFGKVLSPQYLIWLIPFFACLEGRPGGRARLGFLITCGLTLMIYPLFFQWVLWFLPRGIVLLNARNLALVVTYGLLVFDRQAESPTAEGLDSRGAPGPAGA